MQFVVGDAAAIKRQGPSGMNKSARKAEFLIAISGNLLGNMHHPFMGVYSIYGDKKEFEITIPEERINDIAKFYIKQCEFKQTDHSAGTQKIIQSLIDVTGGNENLRGENESIKLQILERVEAEELDAR